MIDILGFFGGSFLIIGAFLLYKGKAFYSLIAYFFADLCWLAISYYNNATFGTISILVGIIFSVGVSFKMINGTFHKNLKKGDSK
jgi:hypothetical protein